MDQFLELLAEQWHVIVEAPLLFLTGAVAVIGLTYAFVKWQTSERFAVLNQRLALRDEELAKYRAGTDTETPEEAKTLIENLERRLRSADPRALSEQQVDALTAGLRGTAGSVEIHKDGGAYGTDTLLGQFERTFRSVGWQVSSGFFLVANDQREETTTGLVLSAYREGPAFKEYLALERALTGAGIDFDRKEMPGKRPFSKTTSTQADWVDLTVTAPLS